MTNLSRRELARWAADQLVSGSKTAAITKELAAVLIASRRQNQAELLAYDITWELEQRGKLANARVTSATALSESLKKDLKKFIKSAAKVDEVIIDEDIDRSVIGGVRIDTASHSWDYTIKRELRDIQEAF